MTQSANVQLRPDQPNASRSLSDSDRRRLDRARTLARLLDSVYTVPYTPIKLGLDPLIGLIPGVGDAVSAALSLYIVWQAHKLGVRARVLAAMIGLVILDFLIGLAPVAGDAGDVFFKANLWNLRLIERELGQIEQSTS
ncbi:MAG: DUF4112 domain-containing protein [Tepidisphaera sp.]|nr:DUF4112 domain-containing protein [Tepidisphaera sp.]